MYLVRQLRLHIFERFSDLHQDQQVSFLLIDVWNIPVEYGAIFIDELPHVGCDLTAMVFQFGLFQFCHFAPPERFETEQLYTLTERGALAPRDCIGRVVSPVARGWSVEGIAIPRKYAAQTARRTSAAGPGSVAGACAIARGKDLALKRSVASGHRFLDLRQPSDRGRPPKSDTAVIYRFVKISCRMRPVEVSPQGLYEDCGWRVGASNGGFCGFLVDPSACYRR